MKNILSTELAKSIESRLADEGGKLGWAVLWLLGVPLPVLLVFYLLGHH